MSANPPCVRSAVELPREEWDFRARPEKGKGKPKKERKERWTGGPTFGFLPDDEVGFCWLYEFDRNSSEIDFILKWREGAKNPEDFDSLLDHYWRTDPIGEEGYGPVTMSYFHVWPEWPAKPFLSVEANERERRYKKMWEANPKRQLRLVPLRDIYGFAKAWKAGENPHWPNSEIGPRSVELNDDTWVLRSKFSHDDGPPAEVAAFVIDYNLGDKVLARRFQNWLAQRRKEKGYARQEHRGKSGTKANRAALVALGAQRLRDAGMSIKEAMDYTEEVSGKALYLHPGDWSEKPKRIACGADYMLD